jgi:acetyl-CoA acetyltransferase
MSGIRLVATLLHRMRRNSNINRGLATACVGVGQGESILFERLS